MHLSMHNWMRSEPIEVTVARLARYGYGSIEIKGEPDQYDTADVRKLLADNGLTCWGAVTLTLAERNLCAKDEQQRAASVQYMKDVVTMVKELEGQEITIVPSTVGKIVPDGTPEQEWEWCVAGLQEIREHANAAGVRMAIEPLNRFETHFVNRGEQALALADAVGPDVGVCLDCFHMNIEEVDLLDTIRAIGPRLTDFHVADNNRLACGMGALDWPAIVVDAEGGRLRRCADRRVRRPDRPHSGQPLPRRPGDQPGRHQPRGAAVHHRPRQQPAVGGLLQHARRAVRDHLLPLICHAFPACRRRAALRRRSGRRPLDAGTLAGARCPPASPS